MAIVHQTDKRSGITYAYESTSWWDKEKQQSRSKRHLLGRVDPSTGEIVPTDGRNRRAKTKTASITKTVPARQYMGATYLLNQISETTGLAEDLSRIFGPLSKMILSLAEYLVLEPNSALYRFEHWQSLHAHPFGDSISSQRSSELFATITDEQINHFFQLQAKRRSAQEYWAYDSTSISSYSQGLKQLRFGRNKEHDQLAQLNLLLVFGEESGLPFCYRKLAGNIPDVKTVQKLLTDLDVLGIDKAKLVMDRGFYSESNVNAILSRHLKFLVGVRTSLRFVRTILDPNLDTLLSFENYDANSGIYGMTVRTQWEYHKTRPTRGDTLSQSKRVYLHLYCNSDKRAEDQRRLDVKLAGLQQELESGHRVERHSKEYEKYFDIKETPKHGRKVTPKNDVIKQAKRYCGYWVLLTNELMTAQEALYIYRTKDLIEKAFGNVKERLNGRRLLVSSEKSLTGKLFIEFIALILVSSINHTMQDRRLYEHYSMQSLLDRLDVIEQFSSPGHRPQVGEILTDQVNIYENFGIVPPSSL